MFVHHCNIYSFFCVFRCRCCSLSRICANCKFGNVLVFWNRHCPLLLTTSLRKLLFGEIRGWECPIFFCFLRVAVIFLTTHASSVHLAFEQHQPLFCLEDFALSHVNLDVELSLAGRLGWDCLCFWPTPNHTYIEVSDFKRSCRFGRLRCSLLSACCCPGYMKKGLPLFEAEVFIAVIFKLFLFLVFIMEIHFNSSADIS